MAWPAFVNWNFSTPIYDSESGPPPYTDVLTTFGAVGDLHIVTLQMWLPSGGVPDLRLGLYISGTFTDQTSDWTALAAVTNGSAFMQSWFRFADSATIAAGAVGLKLDGYTRATEGGNLYLNVLQGALAPTIAYQSAVSSDLNPTPVESPDLPLLHHYFGRSAFDTSNGVNSPIIQPFGRIGHSGTFTTNNGGVTDSLDDGHVPGPPFGVYTDQYGAGFYYPKAADIAPGGPYTGQITWDTQTAVSGFDALGAQTAVIQGLIVGSPPSAQNFMCIV